MKKIILTIVAVVFTSGILFAITTTRQEETSAPVKVAKVQVQTAQRAMLATAD